MSLFIDDCPHATGCYVEKRPAGSAGGDWRLVYVGEIPGGGYSRCYNWVGPRIACLALTALTRIRRYSMRIAFATRLIRARISAGLGHHGYVPLGRDVLKREADHLTFPCLVRMKST